MTNEELKVKIDEFLSKNKFSNIILSNLNLMIKICELYSELNEDLVDVKFSNVNLETYPKLDLFTKIDLVKKLFKKYNYPISDEMFEKILSDGTIDFREYSYDKDYLPNIQSGIVDGSAGIKDDYRFVSTPNTGYITDAVILAHEVAHYIVGISENATDHMISESLAIFTEFLMEDELSGMGYDEEMKYVRKLRFKNTLNNCYLIRILASINVYLNFGDLEYDSYKRMYSKMNEEIYKNEILKVKDAYYMYNKIKNNHSYIDNIYKAYSIPYRDDLGSFSEALGIYDVVGELKDAITSYKKELNNETKIL